MMEIMDHDRFKWWIECEQGLKWSTIPIEGPGSTKKMNNHIHLRTKGLIVCFNNTFN